MVTALLCIFNYCCCFVYMYVCMYACSYIHMESQVGKLRVDFHVHNALQTGADVCTILICVQ